MVTPLGMETQAEHTTLAFVLVVLLIVVLMLSVLRDPSFRACMQVASLAK
jgi:hypothetical protein